MPTYQYACTACSERLEAQQSFTEDPLTQCPACGGRLRKLFNAVGVVFKGSGFYRTDSRASAKTGNTERSDGTATKTEGTDKAAANGKDSNATKGSADKPADGSSRPPAKSASGGNSKDSAPKARSST